MPLLYSCRVATSLMFLKNIVTLVVVLHIPKKTAYGYRKNIQEK